MRADSVTAIEVIQEAAEAVSLSEKGLHPRVIAFELNITPTRLRYLLHVGDWVLGRRTDEPTLARYGLSSLGHGRT